MKHKLNALKYILTGITLGALALTLVVFGIVAFYTDSSSHNVKAATSGSDNVTGWLNITGDTDSDDTLEQTFGWGSLDSSNTELSSPDFGNYGLEFEDVTSAETTGDGLITELELKSGESHYAWSSTDNAHGSEKRGLGWINFNPSGDPPGPADSSDAGLRYVNSNPGGTAAGSTSGGKLTGWVRACSVFKTGCSGATENTDQLGGFDGWIKLDGPNYNPSRTFGRFAGFAWGGPTIGWVEFGAPVDIGNSDYNGFRFTNELGKKAAQPQMDSLNVTGGVEEATLDWTLASGTSASDIAYLRYETGIPAGPNPGDIITDVSEGNITVDLSGLTKAVSIKPELVAVNKFGDTSAPVDDSATVVLEEPEVGSCTTFPRVVEKDSTVLIRATVKKVAPTTVLDNWSYSSSALKLGDKVTFKGTNTKKDKITGIFTYTFSSNSPVGKRNPEITVDITDGPGKGETLIFDPTECENMTYFGDKNIEEVEP